MIYQNESAKMMVDTVTDATPVPAINEDLIRRYATGATEDGIRNLLTLFNSRQTSMTRAEDLSRAYLAQMLVLHRRIVELEGMGQPPSETKRVASTAPSVGPIPRAKPLRKIIEPKASATSELDLSGI